MATNLLRYRYGSNTVLSTFLLPALPATAEITGEVIHVDHGQVACPSGVQWSHHWHDGSEIVLSLAQQGADYWLRFPYLADFLLETAAGRILVATNPVADDNTLEHLLLDQVLPRFLAHRSQLLAHASSATLGSRHALFLGPSGWGKSTLAGLLQRHGYTVFSDDCVQLCIANGRCEALPTYPSLRLYSDSLDALVPTPPQTGPVASYSEKVRVALALPDTGQIAVPVDAIFLLGDPAEGGDTPRVSLLGPSQTCQALIAHSFRLDLSDRDGNAAHFARCAAVVNSVPAFKLDYRRDFCQSSALVGAILKQLSPVNTLSRSANTPYD